VREQQVYDQLKSRHIGLGDSDTTKHEWMTNVHRDSYASVVGHPALLEYLAIAQDKSKIELKEEMIMKMVKPCGPIPKSDQ